MRYLVTGGAGFIGSHIVDRLLSDGHEVIVLDNFVAGKEKNLAQHKDNKNLTIVPASVAEDLTEVFGRGKIDAVFHLAALPRLQFSIDYPIEAHNVNINGTMNLLQACRSYGIKRFIFSSSSSIYGNQDNLPFTETMVPDIMVPYALQKLTGEYYCQIYHALYGLETVALRYFSVYGPRQVPGGSYAQALPIFMDKVCKGESPTITGNGKQTRDFTYVSDVVEANILAARIKNEKCFGQVFNIGGGHNISINDLAEKIINLSGKKIKPVFIPARVEAKDTLADNHKAKKLLGWQPKKLFSEGLQETFDYFRTSRFS